MARKFPFTKICNAMGQSRDVVDSRLRRRWYWDDALKVPHRETVDEPGGTRYHPSRKRGARPRPAAKSFHALAKDLGMTTATLLFRVDSGWSWKKILTTPVRKKKDSQQLKVGGETYAREEGVNDVSETTP